MGGRWLAPRRRPNNSRCQFRCENACIKAPTRSQLLRWAHSGSRSLSRRRRRRIPGPENSLAESGTQRASNLTCPDSRQSLTRDPASGRRHRSRKLFRRMANLQTVLSDLFKYDSRSNLDVRPKWRNAGTHCSVQSRLGNFVRCESASATRKTVNNADPSSTAQCEHAGLSNQAELLKRVAGSAIDLPTRSLTKAQRAQQHRVQQTKRARHFENGCRQISYRRVYPAPSEILRWMRCFGKGSTRRRVLSDFRLRDLPRSLFQSALTWETRAIQWRCRYCTGWHLSATPGRRVPGDVALYYGYRWPYRWIPAYADPL